MNKGPAEECRSRYHGTAQALRSFYIRRLAFFFLRTRVYNTGKFTFRLFVFVIAKTWIVLLCEELYAYL